MKKFGTGIGEAIAYTLMACLFALVVLVLSLLISGIAKVWEAIL